MATWPVTFRPEVDTSDRQLLSIIVEIEAYRRSVLKIPLPPAFKRELDRINIVRQIRGTTAIEGNTLTEEQVSQLLDKGGPKNKVEQEAMNAHRTHDFIVEWHRAHPDGIITEQLIRTIHRLSTEGIDYDSNVPGQFRHHNVTVGAEYSPPSHEQLDRLMDEFIRFINSREVTEGYGPLLRAIMAHFYLISIHPFGDGNGRTSRALEAYVLYSGGYNVRGFYSLSNFYYRNRSEYFDQLNAARFKHGGCLQEFARFALGGFVGELQDTQDLIMDYVVRIVYNDYLDELFRKGLISARCEAIATFILAVGPDGVSEIEFRNKRHPIAREFYKDHKSLRTIDRDLNTLVDKQLVKIEGGRIRTDFSYVQSVGE